jgi:DNA-binding beta-propeller fold protein YncE
MSNAFFYPSINVRDEGRLKMRSALLSAAFGALLLVFGASVCLAAQTLTKVVDVPLPGRASRFDYQSFDPTTKTLYFTHMGDGELVVFDTGRRRVVAHLPGFPTATGVLVVPELHRVFVSVAGRHEVAVVDTRSLKVLARVAAGDFPDGLAYAPDVHKVFVSDESGGREIVIDANTHRQVDTIEMGGEVGNTQYDPASHRILANVQSRNQLVVIDPQKDTIVGRHTLKGCTGPHGLLVLEPEHLAFAACENDSRLLVVDLESFQVKQVLSTGDSPDVLAFDPTLQLLYVATESDIVSVFHLRDGSLTKLENLVVAPHAHTVSVNPETHEVYLPLRNIVGHPVLRVLRPVAEAGHE